MFQFLQVIAKCDQHMLVPESRAADVFPCQISHRALEFLGRPGLGGLGSFLASWGAVSYHGHDI